MSTITLPRAVVEQALKALEKADKISGYANNKKAITALRAALAQQAEPVATHRIDSWGFCGVCRHDRIPGEGCARQECPDSPQQAKPQGCDHCNHPLYAATKCRVCGRVTA